MDKIARRKITSLRQGYATFQIGKRGVSDQIISELDNRLKNNDTIKGKILKTALESYTKEEILGLLKEKLNLNGAELIGSTIIIYRKKTKGFKKHPKKNV